MDSKLKSALLSRIIISIELPGGKIQD